jgi:hypothetical protein
MSHGLGNSQGKGVRVYAGLAKTESVRGGKRPLECAGVNYNIRVLIHRMWSADSIFLVFAILDDDDEFSMTGEAALSYVRYGRESECGVLPTGFIFFLP